MKKVSAGIIITDGNRILGCKSTKRWDLPKGEIEDKEKPIDAAVRETLEETGVKINKKDLTELGFFKYTKYKDLWLYLYVTNKLPDIKNMKCTTYFTDRYGNSILEVSGYKYIPFKDIDDYFYYSICEVLKKVQKSSIFSSILTKESNL